MKLVKEKKQVYTFCANPKIVNEFKKQSYEQSESMSSRIETFMKKENKKGGK